MLAEPKAVKIRNIRHEPRVSVAITTTIQPYSFLQFNGVAELSDQWDKELLWAMSINYQGQEEGERYAERTYRESTFTLITVTPTKMTGWAF
jgi:general stress protein 26